VTVDDAGRRAGAALRDRFDRLPAPPLAETQPRRRRSGRTPVLAGIAAVLVVALLVALVTLGRDEGGPAAPGGTWKRIDQRTAFGRNAVPSVITTWRGKLLALGSQRISKQPPRSRPAVWTSDDGEHWERIEIDRAPSGDFWGFSTAATRGDSIVASIGNNGQLWRSTDARTWRKVADAQFHRGTTYYVQATPDRFVAGDVGPIGGGRTLSSTDGRRWETRDGSTTGAHPVGIGIGAPLRGGWINVGGNPTQEVAPFLYRSPNAVRWTRIDGARAPVRVSSPLAANHERNEVLGIQYDDFPEYGGRLWSTRDGRHWTEIRSFHEQMPVGNPDHLVQVGRWWVLGGNSGVPSTAPQGERRATMWTSPDLRLWYEMPERLRGSQELGAGMPLVEHDGRAIGRSGQFLWIWTPPD
jgi:hypothetical protein